MVFLLSAGSVLVPSETNGIAEKISTKIFKLKRLTIFYKPFLEITKGFPLRRNREPGCTFLGPVFFCFLLIFTLSKGQPATKAPIRFVLMS